MSVEVAPKSLELTRPAEPPAGEVRFGEFHDLTAAGVCKSFDNCEILHGADLKVPSGRSIVLLGPSGSGKTTLLRVIAGLETLSSGTVRIGNRLLSGEGVHVPPERRRIGMLFQERTLFPHLSVARNVGFGLPRADRARKVSELLEMVDLAGFEKRLPNSLSGGQQQRVAMARALAPRPRVLLMDEPFQGLDACLRRELCGEVRSMLLSLGATAVIVTHNPEEAFLLGDEVAIMRDGLILQQGKPSELFRTPASPWVASFIGEANFLSGTASGSLVSTAIGDVPIDETRIGEVGVLVRPSQIAFLHSSAPGGVPGVVEFGRFLGHFSEYRVRVNGEKIIARSSRFPQLQDGEVVQVAYEGPPTIAYPHKDFGQNSS